MRDFSFMFWLNHAVFSLVLELMNSLTAWSIAELREYSSFLSKYSVSNSMVDRGKVIDILCVLSSLDQRLIVLRYTITYIVVLVKSQN